jgi:hypothetical protein
LGLLSMDETSMGASPGEVGGRPPALKAPVMALVTPEAARIDLYGAVIDVMGRTSWPRWIGSQTRTTSGVSRCSSKSALERKTHATRRCDAPPQRCAGERADD